MNEVTSQGPQAVTLRASVVSAKPSASQGQKTGNNLPPDSSSQSTVVEKSPQPETDSIKRAHDNIDDAIAEMNEYTQSTRRDIQFNVDNSSGRTVVSVIDRESREVIRQIPDEIFLKLARSVKENVAAGNNDSLHLINAKA